MSLAKARATAGSEKMDLNIDHIRARTLPFPGIDGEDATTRVRGTIVLPSKTHQPIDMITVKPNFEPWFIRYFPVWEITLD